MTTAVGAGALVLAALLWSAKSISIMATGNQPPWTFELGQLLFPIGVIALFFTLPAPTPAAKVGLTLAGLSILGSIAALLYPLVPGAQISTSDDFFFPYSLFVLVGTAGAFLGLVLIGQSIWRDGANWTGWHRLPLIVGLMPVLLAATTVIHFELPILLIGLSWLTLAAGLMRVQVPAAVTL